MKSAELISLIEQRQLGTAANRLRSEKTHLKAVSLAHPLFDLLLSYEGRSRYHYRFDVMQEEDKKAFNSQLLDVLSALLDTGSSMEMRLTQSQARVSPNEEHRAAVGLRRPTKEHDLSAYDIEGQSLYVRLAGLGWVEGLQLLLAKGLVPSDKDVSLAFEAAISNRRPQALAFLFDVHPGPRAYTQYEINRVYKSLFSWEDAPAELVLRFMDATAPKDLLPLLREAESGTLCDRTLVEWLSLVPGRWDQLHASVLQKSHDQRASSLLAPLLRQYIQFGRFAELVNEALASPHFEKLRDIPPHSKAPAPASWLLHGGALEKPDEQPAYYDTPKENPHSLAQQHLRTGRTIVRLQRLGAQFRMPGKNEETESMHWARQGFCVSRAFAKRHPQVCLPSKLGDTPHRTADSVDTAKAWEAIGALPVANAKGADPWISALQRNSTKDSSPRAAAPWANEIAARLKDGRILPSAMGDDAVSLASLATVSAPLARAWLKKMRQAPPVPMVSAAIDRGQWGLLREWIEAGVFDHSPELREPLLRHLARAPEKHNATDAMMSAWKAMAQAITERPTRPWPDQVKLWRLGMDEEIGALDHRFSRRIDDEPLVQEGLRVLGQWGGDISGVWEEEDTGRLLTLALRVSRWKRLSPRPLSDEDGLDLFWAALSKQDLARNARCSLAQKVSAEFDDCLPLFKSTPQQLRLMEKADAKDDGFRFVDPKFQAILDVAVMHAHGNAAKTATQSSRPRHRL